MSLAWVDSKSSQPPTEEKNAISPWKAFNYWVYDKKDTPLPKELEAPFVTAQIILYFFQCSPYLVELNDVFNNYYIFKMSHKDALMFVKEIVNKTGFRQPFIPGRKKQKETALYKELRRRAYHLKPWEVERLCISIEKHEKRDDYYESLGLSKPKKTKIKTEKKKRSVKESAAFEEIWSLEKLFGFFKTKEV